MELETKIRINRGRVESSTQNSAKMEGDLDMQGVAERWGQSTRWVGMNIQTSEDMVRYAELVASGR